VRRVTAATGKEWEKSNNNTEKSNSNKERKVIMGEK
jgi:hypothetical protein